MEVQAYVTGTLIAVAAGYLAWRGVRAWRAAKRGCGGGCGCAKSATPKPAALIAPEHLVLRQRPTRSKE